MKIFSRLFGKESPISGDVHVSNAGGAGGKKRRKKKTAGDEVSVEEFETAAGKVVKVDESLGLVMGWAIVCKAHGEEYFDLQNDHIPEDAMLNAAADFMLNSRVSKEMHVGDADGAVVFAFPMTAEVAKAFGVETETTGLMIALKPSSDVFAKFRDGTYTGFSIGGRRLKDEIV